MATIGVLAERDERETRVSLVLSSVAELIKKYGLSVLVETKAGVRS